MEKLRVIHHAVLNEMTSLGTIPQNILDVGCGDGMFTQVVSVAFPSSEITAVDTSFSKAFTSDNIMVKMGTAERLPFSSESFD